jgi:hypothetical protein
MYRDKRFQRAALDCGFVEANRCERGSVVWLVKDKPGAGGKIHQRMCVDDLTNSATVYWMATTGKVDSKTFREVPALREWLKAPEAMFVNR